MYVVHFIGARQTEMERESRDAIRSWCTALDELEVGSNWSVPEVCVSVCVLSAVESVIATKQKLKHVHRPAIAMEKCDFDILYTLLMCCMRARSHSQLTRTAFAQ